MTAREHAIKVLDSIPIGKTDEYWIDEVAAEIQAAVEEEREACAKIVESDCKAWPFPCQEETADKIRARSEGKG